ncbi:microcystin-dependent protein [Microterricola gilva]|uniref:Microcystin-dependent protein n=1 Tax=Microterricola gilva TaxID=393267 RepID=A0A4Q8AIZ8_9MICO|nr:tail fiber protein [Microterricola gilva]RZU63739.1 microcystin-dependent protein [Microterricola gilva]
MADPFVAEIRMFPFNFAPQGWAWCDGQLLPLSQNTALFSLLGTTYGGDGKTTFALPNLNGSFPMHPGQGPGLSLRSLGEQGGRQTVTLLESEIPAHGHALNALPISGTSNSAEGRMLAAPRYGRAQERSYAEQNAPGITKLSPAGLSSAGDDQPHNNMPPYLTLYFAIALQGVFPPRP